MKKRSLYFIQEHLGQSYFHGGVGNADAERIFLQNNVVPIVFPYQHNFSIKAKLLRCTYLFKVLFGLPKNAIVFFQYPLYASMHKLLLRLLQGRKTIKVVCFIADINGLKYNDENILQNDINVLRRYNYFILHNENMRNWLFKQIHKKPATALIHFFDFLTPYAFKEREKKHTVVFAGNLEKSLFLEDLGRITSTGGLHFNIYGPNVTPAMQTISNVFYKGMFEPYQLPAVIEGSFGLVWDGDGIEKPEGSMGYYMQYITHHKVSLYILSNLPLIVHEQAGSAELIIKHNIGFTISGLHEIEEKIHAITEAAYRQMQQNTHHLANRISKGGGLQKALEEIIININNPPSQH